MCVCVCVCVCMSVCVCVCLCVCVCVGADVNVCDTDGDTCLHMILRLIARGDAGKHQLVDVFNTTHIPLVCLSVCLSVSLRVCLYSVDVSSRDLSSKPLFQKVMSDSHHLVNSVPDQHRHLLVPTTRRTTAFPVAAARQGRIQ